MAAKIRKQHGSPLTRENLSRLPYEFQKDRPFEGETTRCSDNASFGDKPRELESLSSAIQSATDKFGAHLQALSRVHVEMQLFLSDQIPHKETGEETDGAVGLSTPMFTEYVLLRSAIFNDISLSSADYSSKRASFREILRATPSEDLQETLRQLDIEIEKAIEIIWRVGCEMHGLGWNNLNELRKQWFELQQNLDEQDQMIFTLLTTSELGKDTELQRRMTGFCSSFSLRVTLCVVLGLQPDSVEDFEKMGERAGYYSEEEWILMNLKNTYRYLEDGKKHELSVDSLISLGFTEYAAKALVDSIPTKQRGHRSTIEWLTIYLENQFKYNIFLAPVFYGDFPFREKCVGNWFTLSNVETAKAKCKCNLTNVSMINLDGKQDYRYRTQHRDNVLHNPLHDSHLILYHGTDHLSAKDILFNGIDLMKGSEYGDFSHVQGFYLTKNLKEAIDWAFTRPNGRPSVLVYRVETAWLREGRVYLDLTNDLDRWKTIVQHYTQPTENETLDDELDQMDFIEGPINTDPPTCPKKRDPFPELDSYQLCVKSKRFAREFNQQIHSALFYR